ncbi:hypothetical protein G4O51_09070 [Candidatus Bathyarchaeota archaeon A05DMB-2]|jgi:hypothetical protein|nr:hypothetical protein [Candidatus Bathyarchaeota archaeon A05DMB-2]
MKRVRRRQEENGWAKLFLAIIRAAYLGDKFQHNNSTYNLKPTLVNPYDFSRRIINPSNDYYKLLASLDSHFKDLARTEVYRRNTGWIAQGLKGYHGQRIRRIKHDKEIYLIPVLSNNSSVGIDTSSIGQKTSVIAFCFIPDAEAAYTYLERHLLLPKTHNHAEFKWIKLNRDYKAKILENFNLLLPLCCNALLIIETDAIVSPVGKFENTFKNLIEGCFSGYEREVNKRTALKRTMFQLANNVPIHCDKDFPHLPSDKAVKLFVQTLAKQNGWYERYTPLYAPLASHESKPIQIADIIAGTIRTKIQQNEALDPLIPLPFDKRKIASCPGKSAKAFYWIA